MISTAAFELDSGVQGIYPLQAVVEEALIDADFATDILSSAEEALALFKSGVKEYRALVADVNLMGSLSGWDLARQIREREPTFPVIHMIGAAVARLAVAGRTNSILLQKPFAPAQLVTAISQLLNQNTTAL